MENRLAPGDERDNSNVNIRLTDGAAGSLVVKGDVVTYNENARTQNQVSLTLDNASSSLEGAVKNVDMAGNQVALSGNAGTSLNLSGGAVWTVTGDSTVKAVNTDRHHQYRNPQNGHQGPDQQRNTGTEHIGEPGRANHRQRAEQYRNRQPESGQHRSQ